MLGYMQDYCISETGLLFCDVGNHFVNSDVYEKFIAKDCLQQMCMIQSRFRLISYEIYN